MNRTIDILLTDLRYLIGDLGKDGGLISPSIYDTAQLLRLAPPADGARLALNWLIDQQQPDGGWGDPLVPRARDVPTLAALLALNSYGTRTSDRSAVAAGLTFMRRQASHWVGPLPDDLAVGIELLLPHLLQEAATAGLKVAEAPYAALMALGNRRRRMIAGRSPIAGTTAVHSWEAFGTDPDPALIDGVGGVGNSPAATAAWLAAARDRPELADLRESAQCYLERAAAATGVGIPGVVPMVWPITRFEQSFALYVLFITGLLDHPRLRDVVRPQLDDLAGAFRSTGIGFSDFFIPDGDDTAAAMAVLHASGYPVNRGALDQFRQDDHFSAFPGELQPSISVTAHAVHALSLYGEDCSRARAYLVEPQLADGRWQGDKWNGSWLYTTWQVIVALNGSEHSDAIARAVEALLTYQHDDGGWGTQGSTLEETGYGVLALRALLHDDMLDPAARHALGRAEEWMLHAYRPFSSSKQTCWLDKDAYRPPRLARMIELAATMPFAGIAQAENRDPA